jgi:perosamine synthetase
VATGSVTPSGMPEVAWWRTSFGDDEVKGVASAIAGEHVSQGPVTFQFEAELAESLDVPYVVATTSGSVALLMALMAMGIERGDEVILPNRTFIATAHAALLLGAKVVLVDVLADSPVMDVSRIRQKITSKTKAIMPVHLNGRSVDMPEIYDIAREYGLCVIDDACQGLYSRNAEGFLGTYSDVGCFSLGVTKLISTGQGGFVVTRNQDTYEKLKLIRNHGVNDTFAADYTQIGLNFKYTDIQASIGLSQLRRLSDRIGIMNGIYTKYASAFDELEFSFLRLIPVNIERGEVPLWIEVLCPERGKLMDFLASRGIQTRPFLPDLNLSPHLGNDGEFPRSRVFSEQGVFLPCGPDQPLEHIDRVIDGLQEFGAIR